MLPDKVEPTTTEDTGELRTFVTGATRDTAEGKLDWEGFISPQAMLYFAKYMDRNRLQSDGNLRDADNWQKGFPRREIMRSLVRHTWDVWHAWRTNPAEDRLIELLCAIIFNAQAFLHEIAVGREVSE